MLKKEKVRKEVKTFKINTIIITEIKINKVITKIRQPIECGRSKIVVREINDS
jgi:hypothetical protein